MKNILKSCSTLSQQFCPHTHEQNGVAEQKHHCHFLNTTRALLISAYVPRCLWVEAVLTVVLLINITPSSLLDNTFPYSHLFNTQFDFSSLPTFGCVCFALLPIHECDKLS